MGARAYGLLEIAWKKRRACTVSADMHQKSQAVSAACAKSGKAFYLVFPHPRPITPKSPLIAEVGVAATMRNVQSR